MIYLVGLVCGMTLMGVAMGETWELTTVIYKVCEDEYCFDKSADRRIAEEIYDGKKFRGYFHRLALVEEECRPRVISETYRPR